MDKKKKIKILIVDDESQVLNKLREEFEKHDLLVETTQLNTEAIKALKSDADISVILLDYVLKLLEDSDQLQSPRGDTLVERFREIKKNIPVFYITDKKQWNEICSKTKVNGFFNKDELGTVVTFEFVAGFLKRAAEEWYSNITPAPFFDKLRQYVKNSNYSWHTPGHSGGESFSQSLWIREFYDFFGGNFFRADLSVSVEELDSLLEPKEKPKKGEEKGVIAKAQERAATVFGAGKTYFVTNGTSTANKIVIQTLVQPGEKLILDRNCHKSVHYAVILSGVKPIYLQPAVNQTFGIFGPVPFERIKKAIDENSDAKALILTNCTYDGLIYNLGKIVKYAHDRGLKIIVDEAWFGYAYFHPELKKHSAMYLGADYATQSTHKVLSAFSQASMIHVKDPDFESKYEHIFKEHFLMHTSTSPQYPIIASLDIARKQMELEGYTLIERALSISTRLREAINSTNEEFKVLDESAILKDFKPDLKKDGVTLDRTKLLVNTGSFNAKTVKMFLNSKGIKVEKATFNTLLFLVTIAVTDTKAGTLLATLNNFGDAEKHNKFTLPDTLPDNNSELPRKVFYDACKEGKSEWIDCSKSKGRISAGMVVPYPPGIPILVPGEIVSEDIISYLNDLKDAEEIHGLDKGKIWLLKE